MRHFLSEKQGWLILLFSFFGLAAAAQTPADTAKTPPALRNVQLENVDVAPSAVDTKGWLLLDKDIQLELEGAVQNLYNAKHDKAEKQFRSLRRRYPQHPMPYFLLGLNTWWKMVPSNITSKQYDKLFFAYMDTAITKGERLYKIDEKNYEASFFLAAAYGFDARLHAERRDWGKATVSSKRALEFLDKSKEANGLSPEFLFGQALFNYYAVWIGEEYPWLRPILLFFPKGNKKLGLQQLSSVAQNGFYTGTEAKFFLMRLLSSERENSSESALPIARQLNSTYPDNAYFQRYYAMLSFNQGEFRESERVSLELLDKINRGFPGYDGFGGRYATYFLGWLKQNRYKDLTQAKDYYQRCIVFSEATGQTSAGFYLYANGNLAKMADAAKDTDAARRYYQVVLDKADRKSILHEEAKTYLRTHKKKGK